MGRERVPAGKACYKTRKVSTVRGNRKCPAGTHRKGNDCLKTTKTKVPKSGKCPKGTNKRTSDYKRSSLAVKRGKDMDQIKRRKKGGKGKGSGKYRKKDFGVRNPQSYYN